MPKGKASRRSKFDSWDDEEEPPDSAAGAESGTGLAETEEVLVQVLRYIEKIRRTMQKVRACGIDFGGDIDQQFTVLSARGSQLQTRTAKQAQLFNQEAVKLEPALRSNHPAAIVWMKQLEARKSVAYSELHHECARLLNELNVFYEGIEGLAWNLDGCE